MRYILSTEEEKMQLKMGLKIWQGSPIGFAKSAGVKVVPS